MPPTLALKPSEKWGTDEMTFQVPPAALVLYQEPTAKIRIDAPSSHAREISPSQSGGLAKTESWAHARV